MVQNILYCYICVTLSTPETAHSFSDYKNNNMKWLCLVDSDKEGKMFNLAFEVQNNVNHDADFGGNDKVRRLAATLHPAFIRFQCSDYTERRTSRLAQTMGDKR